MSDDTPSRIVRSKDLVDAWIEREVSRRTLLRGALASAAALALGTTGCRGDGSAEAQTAAEGAAGESPESPGGTANAHAEAERAPSDDSGRSTSTSVGTDHLVAIARNDDPVDAMDAALAAVGGLDFISAGDTVYFKVNSNSGDPYPHSTSPALIVALAARCRDQGATRIIVGDRSFWGDADTIGNLKENGIAGAAERAEAELYAFEDDTVDWVAMPGDLLPEWRGEIRFPKPVVEADHVINMPCVKTHFIAHFTMSLKNAIGLVHPVDRKREGNLRSHDTHSGRLWRQIAQLNAAFTPSMNILDGHRSLITGGPNAGHGYGAAEATYADPKIVIASRDRIAADLTGVALLQTLSPESEAVTHHSAWRQPQIESAVAHEVGLTEAGHFDLAGIGVDEIEKLRELATS